jgi:hypothetical protein
MTQRKENDIPQELLNNEEPAKKRSKLVLPAPQISDQEMEQIVKLGRHSEAARDSVVDAAAARASDTLLSDYAVTPGSALRTPRQVLISDFFCLHGQCFSTYGYCQQISFFFHGIFSESDDIYRTVRLNRCVETLRTPHVKKILDSETLIFIFRFPT